MTGVLRTSRPPRRDHGELTQSRSEGTQVEEDALAALLKGDMEMPLQVGIVGLGVMGKVHFGAYARIKRAKVVVVCDDQAERPPATASSGRATGLVILP